MKRLLAVIALTFFLGTPVPSHAATETLALRSTLNFSQLGAPKAWHTAAGQVARRPWWGTLSGTVGGDAVSVKLDRRAWSVIGTAVGGSVTLMLDHNNGALVGQAGGGAAQMAYRWNTEFARTVGRTGKGALDFNVSFTAAAVRGAAYGAPLILTYNKETGTLSGTALGKAISLVYDSRSGVLQGKIGDRQCQLTAVNLNIADILQYFFLLL
jgi:hypothetical protein